MLPALKRLLHQVFSGSRGGTTAGPAGLSTALREAYYSHTAANRRWLEQWRDLLIRTRPELDAVARCKFAIQFAYLDRRDLRFEYLSRVHPERFETSRDLTAFVGSVDRHWSQSDTAVLSDSSAEYRQIQRDIERLLSEGQQTNDRFGEHLNAVSQTQEYTELLNRFVQEIRVIETQSPLA